MNKALKWAIEKAARGEDLTQEEINAVLAEMPDAVEALQQAINRMANWIAEMVPYWVEALANLAPQLMELGADQNRVLDSCPNRKVAHLAKHAKKYRVRKKNLARAYKIVKETKGWAGHQKECGA